MNIHLVFLMFFRVLFVLNLFILSGLLPCFALGKNQVQMFLRDDVYQDYTTFLAGRDPLEIKSFSGHKIRRDVVDMIIAQQALKLGGFNKTFTYKLMK